MKRVPLSTVAEISMGSAPPSVAYNERGLGVPMIAGAGDFGDSHPFPKKWTTEVTRLAQKGDLILCVRATIGDLNWADRDYCLGRGVAGIRAKVDKADIRYLARVLEAMKGDLSRLGTGSTFLALRKAELDNFEIPLPPLDDQRRIAAVLDKTDAVCVARRESLRLTEKLIQSVFVYLFGDPVTNPRGWPRVPLATLGELDRGVSKHRPRNAPELLGGPYPLIQTGEVSRAGLYIRGFKQTYSEIGLKQSKIWPKGTLCITIAANIAKTAILDFDACFPDSVVGFTPFKSACNGVYVHFLFGFLQQLLEKSAPQVAQKNINLAILRVLEVAAPPLDLQEEFAAIVANVMAVRDDQETSRAMLTGVFASIQQRALRGELDLSRVVFGAVEAMGAGRPQKQASRLAAQEPPFRFLQAPQEIEAALNAADDCVSQGKTIPWFADYFKYRILGVRSGPFSFNDVMQQAETIFDEPAPYGEIRDMILKLLGHDGGRAALSQHFDEGDEERPGRKEILLQLAI